MRRMIDLIRMCAPQQGRLGFDLVFFFIAFLFFSGGGLPLTICPGSGPSPTAFTAAWIAPLRLLYPVDLHESRPLRWRMIEHQPCDVRHT